MRIRFRSAPFLVLTAAILALCFLLPTITAQVQDKLQASRVDLHTLSTPSLAPTVSDKDMLKLLDFASSQYKILDVGAPTGWVNQTEPWTDAEAGKVVDPEMFETPKKTVEAYSTVNTFLKRLAQHHLTLVNENETLHHSERRFTALNVGEDTARIFWQCTLLDESDNYAEFIVDDTTQRVVSFTVSNVNFDEGATTYSPPSGFYEDKAWQQPEKWSVALADYYGLKSLETSEGTVNDDFSLSSSLNWMTFGDAQKNVGQYNLLWQTALPNPRFSFNSDLSSPVREDEIYTMPDAALDP